jgi:hypothetical protein
MSQSPAPAASSSGVPASLQSPAYPVAVVVATAITIVTVILCGLLAWSYGHRRAADQSEPPEIRQLKQELAKSPKDQQLKTRIWAMDMELRSAVFRQRRLTESLAWLLLGWGVLTVTAWKTVSLLGRRLPNPQPQSTAVDFDSVVGRAGRWSVAGFAVVLITATVALATSMRSQIPLGENQLNIAEQPATATPAVVQVAAAKPATPSPKSPAPWPRLPTTPATRNTRPIGRVSAVRRARASRGTRTRP